MYSALTHDVMKSYFHTCVRQENLKWLYYIGNKGCYVINVCPGRSCATHSAMMMVFARGFIPLSPLSIVLTLVMWENSQWVGKNIVWSTG